MASKDVKATIEARRKKIKSAADAEIEQKKADSKEGKFLSLIEEILILIYWFTFVGGMLWIANKILSRVLT